MSNVVYDRQWQIFCVLVKAGRDKWWSISYSVGERRVYLHIRRGMVAELNHIRCCLLWDLEVGERCLCVSVHFFFVVQAANWHRCLLRANVGWWRQMIFQLLSFVGVPHSFDEETKYVGGAKKLTAIISTLCG